ncbi:MAG: hypothetical protein ACJA2S_003176 [Cyclobacteriaceae bacterium]|jgi:hypothetical protein
MLLQVSYYTKEKKEIINSLVGLPFSLLDRFKLRGIGSQRFILQDCPNPELTNLFEHQTGVRYCNIELRPNGVIVWFRVKLDNWILVLPYHKLTIFKDNKALKLFLGKWKVTLIPAHGAKLNKLFVQKLISQKAKLLEPQGGPLN